MLLFGEILQPQRPIKRRIIDNWTPSPLTSEVI